MKRAAVQIKREVPLLKNKHCPFMNIVSKKKDRSAIEKRISPTGREISETGSDYSGDSAPPFRRNRRHLKLGGFVKQY